MSIFSVPGSVGRRLTTGLKSIASRLEDLVLVYGDWTVVQMVTLSTARRDRPKLDSGDTTTSIQHQPNLDDPAQYSALPDN
jgi:hypothetical protein